MNKPSLVKKFIFLTLIFAFVAGVISLQVTHILFSEKNNEQFLKNGQIVVDKLGGIYGGLEWQEFRTRINFLNIPHGFLCLYENSELQNLRSECPQNIKALKLKYSPSIVKSSVWQNRRSLGFLLDENIQVIFIQKADTLITPALLILLSCLVPMLIFEYVIFRFFLGLFRDKAQSANSVIAQLKGGNLEARLPTEDLTEMQPLVLSFNAMADEIKILVNKLKFNEQNRVELLSQLSHDLRTPMSTISSYLETLIDKFEQLQNEMKITILKISHDEIQYMQKMVEDILFLARLDEPQYCMQVKNINLLDLISKQIEKINFYSKKIDVSFRCQQNKDLFDFSGDPLLLGRMIQNILDNASFHALSRIDITLETHDNQILVMFKNDGEKLSPKVSKEFGKRKFNRIANVTNSEGQKVSIGLGSVIICRVAELHGGRASIRSVNEDLRDITELTLQFEF